MLSSSDVKVTRVTFVMSNDRITRKREAFQENIQDSIS